MLKYILKEIEPHAQAALTKKLRLGVFDSLNNHKKLLLCETLLSIGAGDSSNVRSYSQMLHVIDCLSHSRRAGTSCQRF